MSDRKARIDYKKLLTEKLPPGNDAAKVYAGLFIDLDERLTLMELAFTKVVTDLRELLKGQLATETTEEVAAETPPERQPDATPFPSGVSAAPSAAAAPANGPPVAQAAGPAAKTGPVDDIAPNVGGGPAMNPRPNITPPSAKV